MTSFPFIRKVAWVAAMFLAACAQERTPTPSRPAAKPAAVKPTVEAPKVEIPTLFNSPKDEYFYNPVGKRDPFKEYVGELMKEEVAIPRSPLEKYDLGELSLTGIVWGISDPRALIRAPDGYSYIVRSNSRVGKNRGRISRITRRQVFVEEEYRDPTGKLVVRETSFDMHAQEKEPEKEKLGIQLRMSDE